MAISAIGYKIREQRKKLGITQAAVARKLGISAAYLNLIESNKRAVGGKLLGALAAELQLEIDDLSGIAEQQLREDLRELPTDPMFRHLALETSFADELVARNPEWAKTMLTLYRAYLDNNQALGALSDRLNRDPILQDSVHRMMTHITSIRSSAEILNDVVDLNESQRNRFNSVIHSQSAELTDVAQRLVASFELQNTHNPSLSAAEEVDNFIIGNHNYFPLLEQAAEKLRRDCHTAQHHSIDDAVAAYLSSRHKISITVMQPDKQHSSLFRNLCHYDPPKAQFQILANAPVTTRRFQLVRLAAELSCNDAIESVIDDPRLSSDAAKVRARHVLTAYIAGATIFPYDEFISEAERCRYDIEILRQRYNAGFEQVCHRLVTLKNPAAEGIPFAFLRVDAAGHISKRFPLHGFNPPRYGHACPLWTLFSAFQTPARVIRQLAEFPDGHRFLMIAKTVTKRAGAFHDQAVTFAVMLACDALHADRTVYGEGVDLQTARTALKVGSTCRLCNREHCQQRQEAAIIGQHSV
jgi:XRE family transcriptional regulator, fatty acid utilization regulator